VARNTLLRQLYGPEHPNYEPDLQEQIRLLETVRLEDVKRFYETHYGPQRMILVAVGDVDEQALAEAVRRLLGDWPSKNVRARFSGLARSDHPSGPIVRYMADKANVDVYLGHSLPLKRTDADYLPAFVGNFILGGNFSARLMQTVRDSLGLTYGIGSSLVGLTPWTQGHWQITVTLAPENTDRGLEATLEQLRRFVERGVSPEEVEAKKNTLIGNFKVSLATSAGIANTILSYEEIGLGVAYLDRYPQELERINAQQVNEAIRKYFHPNRLLIVIAGTVEEKKTEAIPLPRQ
jgi:predicted Zn-dependent peptidase